MSRDEAPSDESGKVFAFPPKVVGSEKVKQGIDAMRSAKESQDRVDAEQFTEKFDVTMKALEVPDVTAALKAIDLELTQVGESDPKKAEDLDDLRGVVRQLIRIKESPTSKEDVLYKLARTHAFEINRLQKVLPYFPSLDKVQNALIGLANASYHIAQSRFPDQFKRQQNEMKKREDEDINFQAMKAKNLAMKVNGS